jgi:hypothetical protein
VSVRVRGLWIYGFIRRASGFVRSLLCLSIFIPALPLSSLPALKIRARKLLFTAYEIIIYLQLWTPAVPPSGSLRIRATESSATERPRALSSSLIFPYVNNNFQLWTTGKVSGLVSSKTWEIILYSIGNYYLQLWTTWRQSMRTCYEGRGADCWSSVAGLVFLACAAGHRKLFIYMGNYYLRTHAHGGSSCVPGMCCRS